VGSNCTLQIIIINLQWTPKDAVATIKLCARLDPVLAALARALGVRVEPYSVETDAVLLMAVPTRDTREASRNEGDGGREADESLAAAGGGWYGLGRKTKGPATKRKRGGPTGQIDTDTGTETSTGTTKSKTNAT